MSDAFFFSFYKIILVINIRSKSLLYYFSIKSLEQCFQDANDKERDMKTNGKSIHMLKKGLGIRGG